MSYALPFVQGQRIIELGGGNRPMFRPNLDVRPGPMVDIVSDFNKPLPLKSADWDCVFCQYAIEHISWREVRQFIAETCRILKPGGIGVFITANLLEQARVLASLDKWEDKWVCMVFGDNDYPENTHRCGFSPEFAIRLFKEAGYREVAVLPLPGCNTDMIIEARK